MSLAGLAKIFMHEIQVMVQRGHSKNPLFEQRIDKGISNLFSSLQEICFSKIKVPLSREADWLKKEVLMRRRFFILVLSIALIITVSLVPAAAMTAPCAIETFASLNLPETTIMLVESLPAGQNPSPVGNIALPICQVRGVIAPAILFEVWMPTADWNGKFQAVGNGGLAGSISFSDMQTAVSRNYATASTDTGHSSNAPGDPWWINAQQINDYGYRSIHELTLKSKAIINAFYGADPERSYFNGC